MLERIANLSTDREMRQFFIATAQAKSCLSQNAIEEMANPPRIIRKSGPMVSLRLLKNVAGAGPGRLQDREDIIGEMKIPKELCPNPSDTACIRIEGDSMHPLIQDGSYVAVDGHQQRIDQLIGKIVAAQHNVEGLVVKKLMKHQGELHLVSINPLSENHKLNSGWRVVGRVIWWSQCEEPF